MAKDQAVAKRGPDAIAPMKREQLVAAVSERLKVLTGGAELMVPKDYSVGNAIAAWWLRLGRPMETGKNAGKAPIELATQESIITATLDLVVMGLDPARDQCYPIVYGNRVICQVSYFGRASNFRDVFPDAKTPRAVVVYEGDDFDYGYEDGELVIDKHVPGPNHLADGKETGAYCVLEFGDGSKKREYMPIEQIRAAWKQGAANGQSPAHKNFPGEMCKKTIISRACKLAVKAAGHSHLVTAMERQELLTAEAAMDAEVAEHANQGVIDIEADDVSPEQAQAKIEEARKRTKVTTSDDEDGDGETSREANGQASESASASLSDEADPPASSPASRFQDLCDAHDIEPTKARRIVAKLNDHDDVRKITHDNYLEVLEDPEEFLKLYAAEHGQRELAGAGPSW